MIAKTGLLECEIIRSLGEERGGGDLILLNLFGNRRKEQ